MTGSPGRPGRIKKGCALIRRIFFLCDPERGGKYAPAFSVFLRQSVCFSLFQSVSVSVCVSAPAPAPAPAFSCVRTFVVSPVFFVPAVFLSLLFAVAPVFPESLVSPVSPVSLPRPNLSLLRCAKRSRNRRPFPVLSPSVLSPHPASPSPPHLTRGCSERSRC